MEAFPKFFLTLLGPRFLSELYGSFLDDADAVAFVALDPDRHEVLGVVVGSVHPGGHFGRLLRRRWLQFFLSSLSALARRPAIAPRLLRALRYRGESTEGPERPLLSSIAVSPAAQGRGAGRALVLAWLAEVRRRGGRSACLTTDADGNDEVNDFYRGLGWTLEAQYLTPEGRRMNRLVYEFASDESPGHAGGG